MTTRWLAIGATAVLGAACSQDIQPRDPRNLDRPSEMAFGCFGDRSLASGDVVRSAMPVSACLGETEEGVIPPELYGLVLQTAKGTLAVVSVGVSRVLDSDPLVPGRNSIPVGTLPVALAADPEGCHVTIANAGTCDLSILDVADAVDLDVDDAVADRSAVTRRSIVNGAGAPFTAVPRDLVGLPPAEDVGQACPAQGPTHPVYMAYPDCNLVTVVDPGEGRILAGIDFSTGLPVITDSNVSCAASCPGTLAQALGAEADGPPRPVALRVSRTGNRLYVGAENAAMVVQVELDADGLPVTVAAIPLEGDIGVTAMSDTGPIQMGGTLGTFGDGSAGEFSFLYAVATDRTVRVVEVDDRIECDTQVDPRYLKGVANASLFACFPVGAEATPPRRAGARGPGIEMPRDSVPLDVETFEVTTAKPVSSNASFRPATMVGHFAMVTTSDGFGHIINIDDDRYPDFEPADSPGDVYLTLAMAHQLRDGLFDRNAGASTCDVNANASLRADIAGPRAAAGLLRFINNRFLASERAHLLPRGREVLCELRGADGEVLSRGDVSELDLASPPTVRERAFPDLIRVRNEDWMVVWEGPLSFDSRRVDIDGPPIRVGVIMDDGGDTVLVDGAEPFCELGVEEFDIARLLGCQGASQCSLGEECVFHPDTPAVVDTGLCVPSEQVNEVITSCRDVLVSRKEYTVTEAFTGHVALSERRRVLQTSPIDGCESVAQCELLAEVEAELLSPEHPVDIGAGETASPWSYACEADPSRAPGINHCVRTCETDRDCRDTRPTPDDVTTHGDGWVCRDNRCVAGALPSDVCTQTLQRYDIRAGEAFAVVGRDTVSARATGFLHDIVADPATGQCVEDPNASPLLAGRIPLRGLPACSGDGFTDLSPNPCLTTVEHYAVYDPVDAQCNDTDADAETREVEAIRFSNPVFTFHLVQPWTTGDELCLGDAAGELPRFSPVYPGFTLAATVQGGFSPFFPPFDAAFPSEIVKGPRNRLWILDEGDVQAGVVTQGRVIVISPELAEDADPFQVISIL